MVSQAACSLEALLTGREVRKDMSPRTPYMGWRDAKLNTRVALLTLGDFV